MDNGVFGRTNEAFPAKWLRLVAPGPTNIDFSALVNSALNVETVIDVSANPALWGGYLRATKGTLMSVGPLDLSRAAGEQQAHDIVLAHLIETLSAIGREFIDFYFLRVDAPLKESQISGALIALEEARQEKNVRFVGIAAFDTMAAQTIFHFHDAFEVILLAKAGEQSALRSLAKSRRVAVVSTASDVLQESKIGEALLVNVSSPEQITVMFDDEHVRVSA